eukprot:4361228-Amphidinium_carterae.1
MALCSAFGYSMSLPHSMFQANNPQFVVQNCTAWASRSKTVRRGQQTRQLHVGLGDGGEW